MSDILESLRITDRNGTPSGVVVATLDRNGLVMGAGYGIKQGNNVYHDKVMMSFLVVAASVDVHLFVPSEGLWQLVAASYMPRVAGSDGSAVTADIMVTTGVQAPASGTTQLAATFNLKGTADTVQHGSLIASPTQFGLGQTLAVDYTGTLTAAVGTLTVSLARLR